MVAGATVTGTTGAEIDGNTSEGGWGGISRGALPEALPAALPAARPEALPGGLGEPLGEAPEEAPAAVRLNGVRVEPGFLPAPAQEAMLEDVLAVMAAAPPVRFRTRWGGEMSVAMTAAGRFGWTSGPRGYAYAERHPEGMAWPPIPDSVLAVWEALVPGARAPESCLVNLYRGRARMGLHQDRDEADLAQPVISISLGDEALFRVGGTARGGPTASRWLRSGDVAILEGPARLAFHGIDRVREGSSSLVPGGGRINLTLRVVT